LRRPAARDGRLRVDRRSRRADEQRRRPRARAPDVNREETLAATDEWFLEHGLSYFVPEKRADVRNALRLKRTVPLVLLVARLAAAAGVAIAWLSGEFSAAPAVLVALGGFAMLWYALTAL